MNIEQEYKPRKISWTWKNKLVDEKRTNSSTGEKFTPKCLRNVPCHLVCAPAAEKKDNFKRGGKNGDKMLCHLVCAPVCVILCHLVHQCRTAVISAACRAGGTSGNN